MAIEGLDGFRQAVETLKLYRRARLTDDSASPHLIRRLYVDPKPNDAVLAALKSPTYSLLVGRKGTGKSTVFQRLQVDLRETDNALGAYIDVSALFAHAQMSDIGRAAELDGADTEFFQQISLARSFIALTVQNILEELAERPVGLLGTIFNVRARIAEELGSLNDITRYMSDVDASRVRSVLEKMESEETSGDVVAGGAAAIVARKPMLGAGLARSTFERSGSLNGIEVQRVLVRQFKLNRFVDDLRAVLRRLNIKVLYLIIDDYSELPESAMQLFVSHVLEPLHAMAEDLIKFKIGVYPGRYYLGKVVNPQKFDEQYLDPYDLFRAANAPERDRKAIEFVRRLVTTRIQCFCQRSPEEFFEDSEEKTWEALYFCSFATPRVLGYVLFYILEDELEHGKKITVQSIRRAAEKYYSDKVESFFLEGRFADVAISEKSTINGLKGLLERIINRAHELQVPPVVSAEPQAIKQMRKNAGGNIPASHFHVAKRLESFFATLELNNFVTKYAERIGGQQTPVTVFALNYGLCSKYKIMWYGSKLAQSHKSFFMENAFDYTTAVEGYLRDRMEYECTNAECGHRKPSTDREALAMFEMLCPKCRIGTMLEKYMSPAGTFAAPVAAELLLPEIDLGILRSLHGNSKSMAAIDIAKELDCNAQQIGVRATTLAQRGLVAKTQRGSRNLYAITEKARLSYFSREETAKAELDV